MNEPLLIFTKIIGIFPVVIYFMIKKVNKITVYLLPFIIAGASILHLAALHQYGSNNPLGCLATVDKVSFYPYFFFKDLIS